MAEYALIGTKDCPQVDPPASYWLECPTPLLQTVSVDQVLAKLGTLTPYPAEGSDEEKAELQHLKDLYHDRYEDFKPEFLSEFLSDEQKYFRPGPPRAILPRTQIPHGGHHHYIQHAPDNGAELATLFEAETPGEWHRHVLNVIFDPGIQRGFCQTLSPPRQALIWAALDMAIFSALSVSWHLKWRAPEGVGRRRRPSEADPNFKVLFDYQVRRRPGRITRPETHPKVSTHDLELPMPNPGSPRHPAYTSGHSTYSSAASSVLGCFFPEHKDQFAKLADNIGMARLFGGVHWPSDHEYGKVVGQAVADLVIEQLNKSGIKVDTTTDPAKGYAPPHRPELDAEAGTFKSSCGSGNENFCGGIVPAAPADRVASTTLQFTSEAETSAN
jgi:membrane-associated phospholipid phosphatase